MSIPLKAPFLSIIIPAYNEENRLSHALGQVFAFLEQQTYAAEVLVVENGSTDGTLQLTRQYTQDYPNLRVFHEPGRGKGLAISIYHSPAHLWEIPLWVAQFAAENGMRYTYYLRSHARDCFDTVFYAIPVQGNS